jgi:hypothetical protein
MITQGEGSPSRFVRWGSSIATVSNEVLASLRARFRPARRLLLMDYQLMSFFRGLGSDFAVDFAAYLLRQNLKRHFSAEGAGPDTALTMWELARMIGLYSRERIEPIIQSELNQGDILQIIVTERLENFVKVPHLRAEELKLRHHKLMNLNVLTDEDFWGLEFFNKRYKNSRFR